MKFAALPFLTLCFSFAVGATAHAEEYLITLKDQKFTPQELVLPADQKVEITVKNEDAATIEFESNDLRREKLIGPGKSVIVKLGPLKPGKYEYFDEFHEETSRGFIVVK